MARDLLIFHSRRLASATTGAPAAEDLGGEIPGAPAPDGAHAQWEAFVAANGIHAGKVTIDNIGFPVRGPMLAAGEVRAITGFPFSSYFNPVGAS